MPKKKKASARYSPKKKPIATKKLPYLPWLLGVIGIGLVFTISGFSFAAVQESRDPFCASCHTQPESTFFDRSMASSPVDLAAAHKAKEVRCIDCHSGPGIFGRLAAELEGAHNALAHFTGTAVQPGKLTGKYPDENCLKCHQKVVEQNIAGGETQHQHAFLARWQSVDPNAGSCVSCHTAHTTDGTVETNFQTIERTQAVCEACHRVLAGE